MVTTEDMYTVVECNESVASLRSLLSRRVTAPAYRNPFASEPTGFIVTFSVEYFDYTVTILLHFQMKKSENFTPPPPRSDTTSEWTQLEKQTLNVFEPMRDDDKMTGHLYNSWRLDENHDAVLARR